MDANQHFYKPKQCQKNNWTRDDVNQPLQQGGENSLTFGTGRLMYLFRVGEIMWGLINLCHQKLIFKVS